MKLKNRICILSLIFICLIWLLPFTKVSAEDSGIGFSIEPIYSSNQIDTKKDFYYLLTKPDIEQMIEVDVISSQKAPIDVAVSIQNGISQSNGQMGYTEDLKQLDKSLKEPFSSLFTKDSINKVVTVENFEKKRISLKFVPPKESFEGVKVGALVFSEAKKGDKEKGVGNQYAVRIGALLSESGDTYNDSKTLKLNEVKTTVQNSRKLVIGQLQNPEPKLLDRLNFQGEIQNKKNGKIVKKIKANNYTMAPNSHMNVEFDWGVDDIKSGSYQMIIKADTPNKTWELKKDFVITSEEANQVNEESGIQIITPQWVKATAVILGVLTFLIICVIIIRMNKRKQAWKRISLRRKKKKERNKRRK